MDRPAAPARERVLGIDHGERRVGLALHDPDYGLVTGLPTIDRRRLDRPLGEEIAAVVAERRVDRIVVGIPYTMEGEEGPAAREVRAFAAELAATVDVPVDEWDERLTTEAAKRALRETGHSERDMRDKIDQLAAVLLLEGWVRRRDSDRERSG